MTFSNADAKSMTLSSRHWKRRHNAVSSKQANMRKHTTVNGEIQ